MSRIPVSEARATLTDLLDRVHAGEEITITRHGAPVAVLVAPDALRVRRVAVAGLTSDLREALAAARDQPLRVGALSVERADALLSEIDAGRSAR